MSDEYTKRELELIFNRIDEKLGDIHTDIKQTNKHFDARLAKVEHRLDSIDRDVQDIQSFKSRALAIWSVGIVVVGYVLNRYL